MPRSYSPIFKVIHWLMAFMIIGLLVLGFNLDDIPADYKSMAYTAHKTGGFLVLIFLCGRILLRMMHGTPEPRGPRWMQIVAHVTSGLLYGFMALMAVSGTLMSFYSGRGIQLFGVVNVPNFFHESPDLSKAFHTLHVSYPMIFTWLIGLHILGALFHHFILKDDVLKRMLLR